MLIICNFRFGRWLLPGLGRGDSVAEVVLQDKNGQKVMTFMVYDKVNQRFSKIIKNKRQSARFAIKSSNLFKSYVYSLSTNKKYQHKAKQCKTRTKANLSSNIKAYNANSNQQRKQSTKQKLFKKFTTQK